MEIQIKENWMAIICIIVGLLILVFDDLLKWLVGIFLLIIGIGYLLKSNARINAKSKIKGSTKNNT